jgi:hypothetical protein
MPAGFKLEWWPGSNRNGDRLHVGIPGRNESESADQVCRTFRALPVNLTLQLRNPQLLRDDQRQVFRRLRARYRQLRGDLQASGALGEQGRFQRGDVVGKSFRNLSHEAKGITVRVICGALKCV